MSIPISNNTSSTKLKRSATSPNGPEQTKKKLVDNDGPGAGGGYFYTTEQVSINLHDDDGPGAGGGYDDGVDSPDTPPNDGPGAGGGYDDEVKDPDSDGPGAGGGYKERQESFSLNQAWTTLPPGYQTATFTSTLNAAPVTIILGDMNVSDDILTPSVNFDDGVKFYQFNSETNTKAKGSK